jgi:hypothetical protein
MASTIPSKTTAEIAAFNTTEIAALTTQDWGGLQHGTNRGAATHANAAHRHRRRCAC